MPDSLLLSHSDFTSTEELKKATENACDLMEKIYDSGKYPKMLVERAWSEHNPIIKGELAQPKALRSYLEREIFRLLQKKADIKIEPSRDVIELNNPMLLDHTDESTGISPRKNYSFSVLNELTFPWIGFNITLEQMLAIFNAISCSPIMTCMWKCFWKNSLIV